MPEPANLSRRYTVDELKELYPGEWVLLGEPEVNLEGEPTSGVLLAHSQQRDDVYQEGIRLKPRDFAFLCLRGWPEGTSFAL